MVVGLVIDEQPGVEYGEGLQGLDVGVWEVVMESHKPGHEKVDVLHRRVEPFR